MLLEYNVSILLQCVVSENATVFFYLPQEAEKTVWVWLNTLKHD